MYLVVGLGNPGNEYRMTRHNIGFEIIDYIAVQNDIKVNKLKFKGLYGEKNINGEKVIFLKPQTYMNRSGDSVVEFCNFYKIPPEKVIVICDDLSLERGRIRIRTRGSAGGHNGLKSIIYQLKSDEFMRMRVGIGLARNVEMPIADFVLSKFEKDEKPWLETVMEKGAKAVLDIIENGAEHAMNLYNNK